MCRYVQNRRVATFLPLCVALACFCGLLGGRVAYAARPMITDDARVVDAKSCQLETWMQFYLSGMEYWALPGCNFFGNLELTLGGALSKEVAKSTRATDALFQGKLLLKPLEPNGWGAGLTMGYVYRSTAHVRDLLGDFYAYFPASFSFFEDFFVLHVNMGWLYERAARQNHLTWGLGSEIQLSGRSWLISELFGRESFRPSQNQPFFHAGLRIWLLPERLQIDGTYGGQFGNNTRERWFSVGLRLLSPPFLP